MASYGDLIALFHAEAYVAVHRDPKKRPVEFLRPWSEGPDEEAVTPEERERLRSILIASSPFRDQP